MNQEISGYIITGYELKLYCKLLKTNIGKPDYKCVISFGTGMKKFCLTALYDESKPTEIYIDRVDNNELCLVDVKLSDYQRGTVKLIKIALFTMSSFFPNVTKFKLYDDSQLYCESNSKLYKLSLSYDYILKYNLTWYQQHFHAQLPNNSFNNSPSIMAIYLNSLKVLDEPILDYSLMLNRFNIIENYKKEYEMSNTPREFINNLRIKFGKRYCHEVGKWLNQYMIKLQIKLLSEFWYIPSSNIDSVPNYTIQKLPNNNVKKILNGGKSTTKKRNKNSYRIISDSNFTDSFMGTYSEYNSH